jgi:C1A family cysteine protease
MPDGVDCSEPGADALTCAYPVGPVDDIEPVTCVTTKYSDNRVVPPYSDDSTSVDWRDWGVVNGIVDQSSCGSCWAFMAAASVESHYAINTGELYKVSE